MLMPEEVRVLGDVLSLAPLLRCQPGTDREVGQTSLWCSQTRFLHFVVEFIRSQTDVKQLIPRFHEVCAMSSNSRKSFRLDALNIFASCMLIKLVASLNRHKKASRS